MIHAEYKFQWIFKNGNKFRIADFYLKQFHVVIEIDGFQHFTKEGKEKDRIRSKELREIYGVRYIHRFSNGFVLRHGEIIVQSLSRRYVNGFKEIENKSDELNKLYLKTIGVPDGV